MEPEERLGREKVMKQVSERPSIPGKVFKAVKLSKT